MEYALTIDLQWFYHSDRGLLPSKTGNLYDTFSIYDEHGFTVAKGIKEEAVAISIINDHNKGIN